MLRISGVTWAIIVSVIILLTALWLLLNHLQEKTRLATIDIYSFVPADAYLLLDFKDPSQTSERVSGVFAERDTGKAPGFLERVYPALNKLDSVLEKDRKILKAFQNSRLLLSLHPDPRGVSPLLVNLRLPPGTREKELFDFLEKHWFEEAPPQANPFLDANIYSAGTGGGTFYFSFFKGSLLLGRSQRLLEHAIAQYYSERGIQDDEAFSRLRNASTKGTDNFFFRGDRLCQLLEKVLKTSRIPLLPCRQFGGWLSWDVSFPEGELRLNGFMMPGRDSFFEGFQTTPSRENILISYFPSSVVAFSFLSAEEHDLLANRFGSRPASGSPEMEAILNPYREVVQKASGPEDELQAATAISYMPGATADSSRLFLQRLQQPDTLRKLLPKASEGDYPLVEAMDTVFDFIVYKTEYSGLVPALTRGILEKNYPWFCIMDSVLVASSSRGLINRYLMQKQYGQTLSADSRHRETLAFMHSRANLAYYVNLPGLMALAEDQFTDPAREVYRWFVSRNLSIQNLAFEFLFHQPGMFFSYGSLQKDQRPMAGLPEPVWETALEAPLHTRPYSVFNHNDRSREIIVQDKENNLYLIDRFGNILWKKEISGPAVSDIYQVDFYKNNRYQYLFNTRNYIHLIDRNGNYVSGYPIRLPSGAAAGMAVFDYDNDKNYRLLVPGEDRRIYNFNIRGRQVPGWQRPRLSETLERPMQFFRIGDRDYLVGVKKHGSPFFLNRRGGIRLSLDHEMQLNTENPVFAIRNGAPRFIAAGVKGDVFEIYPDGKVYEYMVDTLQSGHHFLVHELKEQEGHLLIFAGKDSLRIFNHLTEKIAAQPMVYPIDQSPGLLHAGGRTFIGLTASAGESVFLFDFTGNLIGNFPLRGDQPFFLESMMQDQSWNLVTGQDNQVVCFFLGNLNALQP